MHSALLSTACLFTKAGAQMRTTTFQMRSQKVGGAKVSLTDSRMFRTYPASNAGAQGSSTSRIRATPLTAPQQDASSHWCPPHPRFLNAALSSLAIEPDRPASPSPEQCDQNGFQFQRVGPPLATHGHRVILCLRKEA